MQQDERLSGALQENILTLLCFDDKASKLIRGSVTVQLFESSIIRDVAGAAIDFIDQYGEAIKEHLPDHLEHILKGDDARKAKAYERLLDNLYTSRDAVNADYVLSQLHKFVRLQRFKSGLIEAVEAVEDGRIDAAEVAMQKAMSSQAVAFDAGLDLSDPTSVANILEHPEEEGFDLNIPDLDRRGIIPRRKELYMLMAPRGKGKSWFLTHCAKQALLSRWRVVVVTLEMSQLRYGARMLQSFFSITRRAAEVEVTRLVKNRDGDLEGMIQEKIQRMSMRDENNRADIISRAKREFKRRKQFRIKEFPTGGLDMAGLEAYLDGLERFENFTPDAIILDYPDLMKLDAKNLRTEIGALTIALRGLAVRRNAAVITVSQGNRDSETATTVTGNMASEDISKLAHADQMLTLSQTPAEYKLNLARLLAEKSRNEEAKVQVLITQSYAMGQFCIDSVLLGQEYWELMEDKAERSGSDRRRRRSDRGEQDD